MRAYNFGDSGRNQTKFYQVMWHTAVVITCTLILQGVPKFSPIFNNFRLWSQISPERINVSKAGKVLDQLHFNPYWAKTKLVNFGPQTKKLQAHMLTHPIRLFSGNYISAH